MSVQPPADQLTSGVVYELAADRGAFLYRVTPSGHDYGDVPAVAARRFTFGVADPLAPHARGRFRNHPLGTALRRFVRASRVSRKT